MRLAPLLLALVPALVIAAPTASAQGNCRVIDVDMTPSDDLQIVAWLEDTEGNYVGTVFITRATGSLGLGNRPGIMEFNSGPLWPYGRRTTTFPVWADRHGLTFPLIVFQNGDDFNLSHPLSESSLERAYCRPLQEGEPSWDANTCATTAFTDKGLLSPTELSKYPPRTDLMLDPTRDHPTVSDMGALNPFDVVSHATPPGGDNYITRWSIPGDIPNGNYVLWVEVAKEFDQNSNYDFPAPTGIPWSQYGLPYRGQPSVLYRVDFEVSDDETFASTLDYAGYSDPDGIDSAVRPPDSTITEGVAGSGAGRLLITDTGSETYRVRIRAQAGFDDVPPGAVGQLEPLDVESSFVTASFIAPGDDDQTGTVSGYEVRYMASTPITAANFDQGADANVSISPNEAGTIETVTITGLLPRTHYYIGVRAFDDCLNPGELEVLAVTTPEASGGAVDACFVATAAYGSLLATDVVALREFRDRKLRTHLAGELLVESYYTFGPLLAAFIEPSDDLRRAARIALEPAVDLARAAP